MYIWVKLYLSTLPLYPPHPRTRDPALWAAQKDWVAPRVALLWWNIYSPLRGYRSNYFHRPFFLSTFYVFLSFNAFVLSKANFQAWPSDSRPQRSHISLSPLRKRDLLGFIVFQLYVIFLLTAIFLLNLLPIYCLEPRAASDGLETSVC